MNAYSENENNEYTKKQRKVFFIGALFFGVLFLFLAIYQFKYSLKSPFSQGGMDSGNKDLAKKEDDVFMLQNMDTDKDGISDYDELYVYNSSPYLDDTDSDSYSDKVEIENNNDPNCPQGKNCKVDLQTFQATSTFVGGISDASQNIDINFLRVSLLNEGVSPDILSQISDEELMREYMGVVNTDTSADSVNGGVEKSSSIPANNINKDELKNLTAKEIRELLKAKGMDEQVLNSIDDETLKKDFEEELNKL